MNTPGLTPSDVQDLGGLSAPGAQAPAGTSAPTPTQAAGGMVNPSGPHGRLLAMVQSLAVGVDSFARATATHGREGGVGEVQDYFAKQQAEKLQQEQATTQQARAKQESEESDLRMSAMRANMAISQFQFEQARMRAPLELQKDYNDVAEQQMNFMEHLAKATGLPLMVINSMSGDGTQKTLGAMSDVAQQNNTTVHDAAWSHVQNDGSPGNGSQIKGFDLKQFGNTVIPADSASLATLPIKSQLELGTQVLGADDPSVKGGQQAFELLKQGLASGQMTANQYYALSSRITAPIVNAMGVKSAAEDARKKAAEATEAEQKANPEFQVSQAASKAAAEAKARQPYEVQLKQMDSQIQAGVAGNKDARDKVSTNYLKPFADKMQNVDELKASVAGAEAGNVASSRAVLLKLLGVSTPGGGQRKISPEALKDMGSMGSVPQKFIGSIKDALTGDKWTKEMSEDILAFANDQAKTAETALRSGIKQTNALYNTKIDPEAVLAAAGVKTADNLPQGGGKAKKWGIPVPSAESLHP